MTVPSPSSFERFGFVSKREGEAYVFEIEFTSNLRLVTIVRRFIEEYYGELFDDEETLSRLAMVTHELMENAMKYAHGATAKLAVEYTPTDNSVSVRTFNPASNADHTIVGALIDSLRTAPDPMNVYLALMRDTAKRSEGSGLGLARICVEAEMELSHSYEAGLLNITASAHLGGIQ